MPIPHRDSWAGAVLESLGIAVFRSRLRCASHPGQPAGLAALDLARHDRARCDLAGQFALPREFPRRCPRLLGGGRREARPLGPMDRANRGRERTFAGSHRAHRRRPADPVARTARRSFRGEKIDAPEGARDRDRLSALEFRNAEKGDPAELHLRGNERRARERDHVAAVDRAGERSGATSRSS